MAEENAMSQLKISDVQRLFSDHGAELLGDYRSVVTMIRKHKIDSPLENSNYLHALQLTQLMLEHTSQQFRMLTGGMLDGFIGTLAPHFESMLQRIKSSCRDGNTAFARVILVTSGGVPVDCPVLDELQSRYDGVLDVSFVSVPEDAGIRHFIVGDNDMVRDEEEHDQLSLESDASMVRAKVSFFAPAKAKVFARKFDSYWDAVGQ